MKEVTIDNVKARIAELEWVDQIIGLGLHAEFELACLRQLLASLGAEPVGEVSEQRDGLVMDGTVDLGGASTHRIIKGASKMKRLPLGTKFYTAPPAPVSVPDAMEMDDDFDSAFEHGKAVGWNAYRAAMLKHSEPFIVTSDHRMMEMPQFEAINAVTAMLQGAEPSPATDNTAQQFEALATSQHGSCSNCGGTGAGTQYTGGECQQCLGSGGGNESTSKLDARRRRNRQANATARAKETPEQANQRRAANRDRMRAARGGKQ